LEFGVWGLGFGVRGSGSRVQGLGLGVKGLGLFGVQGCLGFGIVWGSGFGSRVFSKTKIFDVDILQTYLQDIPLRNDITQILYFALPIN
jgi:hypothetical protein